MPSTNRAAREGKGSSLPTGSLRAAQRNHDDDDVVVSDDDNKQGTGGVLSVAKLLRARADQRAREADASKAQRA